MTELRKQFEELPEINEILKGGQYKFISNDCGYYSDVEGVSTEAIDLAWYTFQEQQKLIDRFVDIIHNAYMSDGNSSVEIVYDKIQELLK